MHRCSVWLPGLCPDLCLTCRACLACLERSRRINASASCPTPRFACTSNKPLQICFQMASFGHLSVRIWIRQLSNPETPSQSYGRFTSRWLHLETVRSRFGLSRFQVHRHIKKTIADFVRYGFIRTPFCPDLDQAIFEPRYTFPKPLQICFQMASFGCLSA